MSTFYFKYFAENSVFYTIASKTKAEIAILLKIFIEHGKSRHSDPSAHIRALHEFLLF